MPLGVTFLVVEEIVCVILCLIDIVKKDFFCVNDMFSYLGYSGGSILKKTPGY